MMIQDQILGGHSKLSRYFATDLLIIAVIFLLPTLSHLTSIPFYVFDPMRWAVVFCIINTNSKNSLIIALTVPIFSLIISSHPVFVKSLLIIGELSINIILFYYLTKRINVTFTAILLSILIAKLFYYSGKWLFMHIGFLRGDLISTSIWIQVITVVLISTYAAFSIKSSKQPTLT